MKPIRLELSNFGCFYGKTIIDFTKLYDTNLYLISGDTGSGKTTIFDAVMYALYGERSGTNRKNLGIRSDYAAPNDDTYVILDFELNHILYKIERMPSYIHGKNKHASVASAVLSYNNKIIEGTKNVDEEILNIIGLDKNQFRQVIMLSQGEFEKLITSSSKERDEIFRKIFNTYIYKDLNDALKTMLDDTKKELEIEQTLIENKLVDIKDYNLNINPNIIDLNDLSNDVNKLMIDKEKSLKEITTVYKKINKEHEILISNISTSKMINDDFNELEHCNKEYNELLKEEEKYQELSTYLSILTKISKIKDLYLDKNHQYDSLINKEKQIKNLNKELKDNKQELDIYIEQLPNVKKDEESLLYLKNKLKEVEDAINKIENINKYQDIINNTLLDIYNDLDLLEIIINEKDKSYKEALDIYNKAVIKSHQAEILYYNNNIAMILPHLEDNKPCPICGSLEHPSIAKVDKSITKEEFDQIKEALNKSLITKDETFNILNDVTNIYNKHLSWVLQFLKIDDKDEYKEYLLKNNKLINISANGINDINILNDNINKDIEILIKNKSLIDNESSLLNKDMSLDEYLDTKNVLNEEIIELEEAINEFNAAYEKLNMEVSSLNDQINLLKEEQISLNNKYQKSLDNFNKALENENISNDEFEKLVGDTTNIKDLTTEINNYNNNIANLKKTINNLNKKLVDKKIVNLDELTIHEQNLKEKIDDLNKKLLGLDKEINNLKNFNNFFIEHYDLYKELYKKVENLKILSQASSGNNSLHLSFERYILIDYFDKILEYANIRLDKMSSSRYQLIRRKNVAGGGQQGLDIDVMDYETGKAREVNTFSGGEMFKAALSLALGLADVISSSNASVEINSLFIDEGFGSLDPASLNLAVSTLADLSNDNKNIAIISHVQELQDIIPNQLIVEKTSKGSKIKIK